MLQNTGKDYTDTYNLVSGESFVRLEINTSNASRCVKKRERLYKVWCT